MESIVNTQSVAAVRGNIWKLYVIQALTQALFAIPIIVLFYRSLGLGLRDVMLLQSGFALTILLFEIPTGYLADRWGRKRTIAVAGVFDVLGYVVYASSTGFWQIMLAEVIIGIGVSLRSGAMEAITYDTLLELKEEHAYRRVSGNQVFFEFGTEALSSIIGGAIAFISLALPLWLTTVPATAAFVIALTLREPKRHVLHDAHHGKAMWDIALHTLLRHRGLRSITLLYAVISTLTLTYFWFFQAYQTLVGFPVGLFGLSHAAIVLAGACAAKYVSTLEKNVDDRFLLMAIAATVVGCYLVLAMPPAMWGLLFFLFSRIAWGFLGPLTSDMMNRMTSSDVRATVLSVRSFLGRLIFVCTSPFAGLLADVHSIPVAMLVAGVVGGVALLMIFLAMKSVWRQIPS